MGKLLSAPTYDVDVNLTVAREITSKMQKFPTPVTKKLLYNVFVIKRVINLSKSIFPSKICPGFFHVCHMHG